MGLSVVVGGQFGSEGKGKVVNYFAKQLGVTAGVKVGGTNAGHTVICPDGKGRVFRVLPSACTMPGIYAVLSAGCCFKPSLLFEEIEAIGFDTNYLKISPLAGIITDEISFQEKGSGLVEAIGSTGSGTGIATANRIKCDGSFVAARDIPELHPYICDTTEFMRDLLNKGREVIIEGTQGYGLSLYHTPQWPYCTSRDTTAASFVSEAGLSPFDVTNVIMVLRTYPIRVAGNSGPLPLETGWETVTKEARSPTPILEYTSVSKKIRRVAHFHPDIVREATGANKPNIVVMNFMDYIWDEVPNTIGTNRFEFLMKVWEQTGCSVTHVGFGPDNVMPVLDCI